MKQHTPEPWARGTHSADNGEPLDMIFGCDGRVVVGDDVITTANARRIVACVNACAGWETGQLEAMEQGSLKESLFRVTQQRDALQAQVDELLAALVNAKESLGCCYDVCDWPCDGSTDQDKAIAMAAAVINKITGETK